MTDKVREEFEKWWSDKCGSDNYIEKDDAGKYYEHESNKAFDVWQAGRQSMRDEMQAKIDMLMMEYCPTEMTREQLDRWAECQKAIKELP